MGFPGTDFPGTAPNQDYLRLDARPAADGGSVRLIVHGELDSQTSSLLAAAVADLVERPLLDRLVLDLSELTFIDAAGIRCLLECEAAAERNDVRLELRDAPPAVVRIFGFVGLARHFGCEAPREEARDGGEVDDLRTWSVRARRQAHDTCLRAQRAVQTSSMLRDAGHDVSSARPTQ